MTVNELIEDLELYKTFEDDWDGNDGLPISNELCDRVIMSIRQNLDLEGLEINPCCNGSLDLSWEKDGFRTLINIDKDLQASYFGKMVNGDYIKGKFNYFYGIPYYLSEFINSNLR